LARYIAGIDRKGSVHALFHTPSPKLNLASSAFRRSIEPHTSYRYEIQSANYCTNSEQAAADAYDQVLSEVERLNRKLGARASRIEILMTETLDVMVTLHYEKNRTLNSVKIDLNYNFSRIMTEPVMKKFIECRAMKS